jgi:hypothetical protein
MHAILCFSASHLKHLHPDSHEYDQSILLHKHDALSLLRKELDTFSSSPYPSMNEAAYGTGTILAIQSIGSFKADSTAYPTDLNWILMMTGFKSLVVNMWSVLRDSIFFPLVDSFQRPSVKTPADEQLYLRKFSLDTLHSVLPPSYSNHITELACLLAPYFPQDHYPRPPPCSSPSSSPPSEIPWTRTLRQLLGWIATLPDSFVPRAKEGDPSILMALWWAFALLRELHSCRSALGEPLWWIERISKEGVEDTEKAFQGNLGSAT